MQTLKRTIKLSLFITLFLSLNSFTTAENEWTKYKEIDGVSIYQRTSKCNTEYNTAKNDYIVFKYVNNNNHNIRISWKLDIWYNDICRSCDLDSPNEYELSLDIKANQTLEYICSENSKAFKLFKASEKGNMHPKIKYEFKNLRVIEL